MKIKKNLPLISVIMPVYNGEAYLAEAMESVLSQTYQNFEYWIIDDHSTDSTLSIIKTYITRYPGKIHFIKGDKRRGAYGSANLAIAKARGEYLAIMDADDISHPTRFEKQIRYLLENPDVIIVGTQAKIIDKDGNYIGNKNLPLSHKEIYETFIELHPLVHPSCMIRRSLLPNPKKLYKNRHGVNDDYFTFFHLLDIGKFVNLSEHLISYRIHLKNSSLKNVKQKFFNSVVIRLKAIFLLDYKPTGLGLLKMASQIVILSWMPDKMIFYLYLLKKKIYTPSNIYNDIQNSLSIRVSKVNQISRSFLTTFFSL